MADQQHAFKNNILSTLLKKNQEILQSGTCF